MAYIEGNKKTKNSSYNLEDNEISGPGLGKYGTKNKSSLMMMENGDGVLKLNFDGSFLKEGI